MKIISFILLLFIAALCYRYSQLKDRVKTTEAQIDSIRVILAKIARDMPDKDVIIKISTLESALWDLRSTHPCLKKACRSLQTQDSLKALRIELFNYERDTLSAQRKFGWFWRDSLRIRKKTLGIFQKEK